MTTRRDVAQRMATEVSKHNRITKRDKAVIDICAEMAFNHLEAEQLKAAHFLTSERRISDQLSLAVHRARVLMEARGIDTAALEQALQEYVDARRNG